MGGKIRTSGPNWPRKWNQGDTIPGEVVREILADYDALPMRPKSKVATRQTRDSKARIQMLRKHGITERILRALIQRRDKSGAVREFIMPPDDPRWDPYDPCSSCICAVCARIDDCPEHRPQNRCNAMCGNIYYTKLPLVEFPKMIGKRRDESKVTGKGLCKSFQPHGEIRRDDLKALMPSSFVSWDTQYGHGGPIGLTSSDQARRLREQVKRLERRAKKNQPPVRWIMRDGKPVDEEEAA